MDTPLHSRSWWLIPIVFVCMCLGRILLLSLSLSLPPPTRLRSDPIRSMWRAAAHAAACNNANRAIRRAHTANTAHTSHAWRGLSYYQPLHALTSRSRPVSVPSNSSSASSTSATTPTSSSSHTSRSFMPHTLLRSFLTGGGFTKLWRATSQPAAHNESESHNPNTNSDSNGHPSSHFEDHPSAPLLWDATHLLSTGLLDDKKERLRCLEVDDSGNYRDVEFSRAELSSMLDLHPRDLRFLDTSMRNLPSILARRRVIIVNLEMFKALITADRVLMFDPWYPHVQSVVQPLQGKQQQHATHK